MSKRPPLVIIVGPTASGKSDLAIKLAKRFDGEIISADSRQVYRGMDIGTGKVTRQQQKTVPHHLLDIASPKKEYNVSHFQRDTSKAIRTITDKGKVPLLVGGSAFWIDAVAYDMRLPHVTPNRALRSRLSRLSLAKLHAMLKKLDPERARFIDSRNPYRLIRAIEIVKATGEAVGRIQKHSPYSLLWLGMHVPRQKLYQRIDHRLTLRLRRGMMAEITSLLRAGVPARRLISIGLEYRYGTLYLQGKLTKQEMTEQLKNAIHHYAKRQMTWWKRNNKIRWVKGYTEASHIIKSFLDKQAGKA